MGGLRRLGWSFLMQNGVRGSRVDQVNKCDTNHHQPETPVVGNFSFRKDRKSSGGLTRNECPVDFAGEQRIFIMPHVSSCGSLSTCKTLCRGVSTGNDA